MTEETDTQNVEEGGISPLVAKVIDAAGAVREEIRKLDGEIEALQSLRRTITEPNVSKSDFMDYVREDIKRRGARFPIQLQVKWAKKNEFNIFDRMERMYCGHAGGLQPIPYLSGDIEKMDTGLEPAAFFWFFGELVEERFAEAINDLPWPEDVMSVIERRERIKEIDAEINQVSIRRDDLRTQLKTAIGG